MAADGIYMAVKGNHTSRTAMLRHRGDHHPFAGVAVVLFNSVQRLKTVVTSANVNVVVQHCGPNGTAQDEESRRLTGLGLLMPFSANINKL